MFWFVASCLGLLGGAYWLNRQKQSTTRALPVKTGVDVALGFWNDEFKPDPKKPVRDLATNETRPRINWGKGWGATDFVHDIVEPAGILVANFFSGGTAGGLVKKVFDQTPDERAKLAANNNAIRDMANAWPLPDLYLYYLGDTMTAAAGRGASIEGWGPEKAVRFVLSNQWDGNHKAYAQVALLALVGLDYGIDAWLDTFWRAPKDRGNAKAGLSAQWVEGRKHTAADADRLIPLYKSRGAAYHTTNTDRNLKLLQASIAKMGGKA